MNRTQISIKLDTALLARIDLLAEAEGRTRTDVIERAIKNDLPEQEKFRESLENPVLRAVHKWMTSSPDVLKAIASHLDDEQIEKIIESAPKLRENAISRKKQRKESRKKGGDA